MIPDFMGDLWIPDLPDFGRPMRDDLIIQYDQGIPINQAERWGTLASLPGPGESEAVRDFNIVCSWIFFMG